MWFDTGIASWGTLDDPFRCGVTKTPKNVVFGNVSRERWSIHIYLGSNLPKRRPTVTNPWTDYPTPDRNSAGYSWKSMFSVDNRNIYLVTSFELQEKSFASMSSLLIFLEAGIIFFRKILEKFGKYLRWKDSFFEEYIIWKMQDRGSCVLRSVSHNTKWFACEQKRFQMFRFYFPKFSDIFRNPW